MDQLKRILVVDDEALNRELLVEMLESFGHVCETALNGAEALEKLNPEIDLVLLDVMMPVMDGFEAVSRIRFHPTCRDVPIIMATALTDKQDRLQAVRLGANDFIAKPVDKLELRLRTDAQLAVKESRDALKRHEAELEETVKRRTVDLRRTLETLVETQKSTHAAYLDTIHRLALAAEFKDEQTAAHIERVSHYCALVARGLEMPEQEVNTIFRASPMHDVGKIGIPDVILRKPGKLTREERAVMEQHTLIGGRILGGSASELLQAGEVIALSHHERWDGTGYPNRLSGKAIPLYGRICAVADVFDALVSKRSYKDAFPNERVYAMLQQARGSHFDPKILDIFFAHLDEVTAIQQNYPDEERRSLLAAA
jgi:putative two-component system response regulator